MAGRSSERRVGADIGGVHTGPSPARPWLSRNLKVVSGISFLQDAATEMLYPVLPIFLTVVLEAPVAVVGIVEGAADATASVTKAASGRLADRWRRVPLIGAGYALAALGKAMLAAAGSWPMVLAGRCVDRVGKGVRSAPRDALIVADVAEADRGRAFGFHRAADTAGAVVGPLAGLGLLYLLDGEIRPLLVVAVVPALLSVALVLALREPSGPRAPRAPRPGGAGPRLRDLPRPYWRVVALLGLFALVNFPDALLLLRLHEIGFPVTAVVAAYIAYNVVYAALSYPAGMLADRLPSGRVFAVGLVLFAVAYGGLGLTRDHTLAWILVAAYGGYSACTDGVGKAWVSRLLPASAQGTGQGVYQGLTGLGVLVAGLWAGLLWGADGTTPLLVSGIVGGVAALLLLASPQGRAS